MRIPTTQDFACSVTTALMLFPPSDIRNLTEKNPPLFFCFWGENQPRLSTMTLILGGWSVWRRWFDDLSWRNLELLSPYLTTTLITHSTSAIILIGRGDSIKFHWLSKTIFPQLLKWLKLVPIFHSRLRRIERAWEVRKARRRFVRYRVQSSRHGRLMTPVTDMIFSGCKAQTVSLIHSDSHRGLTGIRNSKLPTMFHSLVERFDFVSWYRKTIRRMKIIANENLDNS